MAARRWWLAFLLVALLATGCGGQVSTARVLLATPSPATTSVTPTGVVGVPLGTTPGVSEGGSWATTGAMSTARLSHTASLLPGGRVLVVGGATAPGGAGRALGKAEIYDTALGRWTDTASPSLARSDQTATVLLDGRVIVIGGRAQGSDAQALRVTGVAEAYDAATGRWQSLAAAPTARSLHTATLLTDGTILVVGGTTGDPTREQSTTTAEIYNPATNTWTPVGALGRPRQGHTATLLPNGRVLVSGGESRGADGANDLTASAEVYDPATRTWSATGPLSQARRAHTATLLPDGRVLVAGGDTALSRGADPMRVSAFSMNMLAPLASAELYDPQTGNWQAVAALPGERSAHTATLLTDGQVLLVGGDGPGARPTDSTLRYDPLADRWVALAAPLARAGHTATLLPDGAVLVVGGRGSGGTALAEADRYVPQPRTVSVASPPAVPSANASPTATATRVPPSPTPTATLTPTVTATHTPTASPQRTTDRWRGQVGATPVEVSVDYSKFDSGGVVGEVHYGFRDAPCEGTLTLQETRPTSYVFKQHSETDCGDRYTIVLSAVGTSDPWETVNFELSGDGNSVSGTLTRVP